MYVKIISLKYKTLAYGRAGSGENSGEGGENTENVAKGNLVVIDRPQHRQEAKKGA